MSCSACLRWEVQNIRLTNTSLLWAVQSACIREHARQCATRQRRPPGTGSRRS